MPYSILPQRLSLLSVIVQLLNEFLGVMAGVKRAVVHDVLNRHFAPMAEQFISSVPADTGNIKSSGKTVTYHVSMLALGCSTGPDNISTIKYFGISSYKKERSKTRISFLL